MDGRLCPGGTPGSAAILPRLESSPQSREYSRTVPSILQYDEALLRNLYDYREKRVTGKTHQKKLTRLNWLGAGVLLGAAASSLVAQTASTLPNNYLVHNLV